jgi:hypothetical protein
MANTIATSAAIKIIARRTWILWNAVCQNPRSRNRGNRHRLQRKKSARYWECKISRPCPIISSHAPDIREQITKITGKGVDIVIDCVGAENTTRDAFRLLNKGGALCGGGYVWK